MYPLLPSDLINELFSLIAVSGPRVENGLKGKRRTDRIKGRKEEQPWRSAALIHIGAAPPLKMPLIVE